MGLVTISHPHHDQFIMTPPGWLSGERVRLMT